MSLLDRQELRALMEAHPGWCVSIYLPTHRAGECTKQDPIRLRNLLKEAEARLMHAGLRTVDARLLLQPARQLEGDSPFWRHLADGLALFIASDFMHEHRLPFPFQELVVVGRRFHLKPLLPLLTGDGQFYILALSQNGVRLLRGARHSVAEIELEDIPVALADTLRHDDRGRPVQSHPHRATARSRESVFFGHGVGGEEDKKDILRYFRQIDRGLRQAVPEAQAPLVLAGVDYLFPLYREASTYPRLLDEGIPGSPEEVPAEALHRRAWVIVQPVFVKARREAADRYRAQAGTALASADIEHILSAAYQARVEALFVALGVQVWGTWDPQAHRVVIHQKPGPAVEDLLDLAAIQTMLHGGTVFAVQPEEVPDREPCAAVFRY
jgi:hypothetical protein